MTKIVHFKGLNGIRAIAAVDVTFSIFDNFWNNNSCFLPFIFLKTVLLK